MVLRFLPSMAFIALAAIMFPSHGFANDSQTNKSSDEWVGSLDAYGGVNFNGTQTWTYGSVTTEKWDGGDFGLSAHASHKLGDRMSVQIDASAQTARYDYKSTRVTDTWTYYGSAIHGTYQLSDSLYVGPIGSVGQVDYSLAGTSGYGMLGLEAIYFSGDYRLYAQAGQVMAASGVDAHHAVRDNYAILLASYYFNPNLALSGSVGFDRYTSDDQNTWYNPALQTRFGARIDYKPESMPFTLYASFSSSRGNGDFNSGADTFKASSNYLYLGLSLPFGVSTIKDSQRRVGLVDLNPVYGQFDH